MVVPRQNARDFVGYAWSYYSYSLRLAFALRTF